MTHQDFQLDKSKLFLPVSELGYIDSHPVAEEYHEPEDEPTKTH